MTEILTAPFQDVASQRVSYATPREQAIYWIARSKAILNHDPTTEEAQGAAWMLDSPATGYYVNMLTVLDENDIPVLDEDELNASDSQFFVATLDDCLRAAKLATEIAPDSRNAWRTRALLAFRPPTAREEASPRAYSWQETLSEAAHHDPRNALYDYLTSAELMRQSATLEFQGDMVFLRVRDESKYAEAIEHFDQGQQKDFLSGARSYITINKFLDRVGIFATERPELIASRRGVSRESALVKQLLDFQIARANTSRRPEAIAHLLACERLANQLDRFETSLLEAAFHIAGATAAELSSLLQKSEAELTQTQVNIVQTAIDRIEARNRLRVEKLAAFPKSRSYRLSYHLITLFVIAQVPMVILSSLLWGIGYLVGRNRADGRDGVGGFTQALCAGLGLFASVCLFWVIPSGVLSLPTQKLGVGIILSVIVATIVILAVRKRNWRFSLTQLLVIAPVIVLLLTFSLQWVIALSGPVIPAIAISGAEPNTLRAAVQGYRESFLTWGFAQWLAYSGPLMCAIGALSSIAAFTAIRFRSASRVVCMGITIREVGQLASYFALFGITLFLSMLPIVLHESELVYDQQMYVLSRLL